MPRSKQSDWKLVIKPSKDGYHDLTITAKSEASGKALREVSHIADLLECLMMGAQYASE